MERLSISESLHSARNRIFWELRSRVRFQRTGFCETGANDLNLSPAEALLELRYGLRKYRHLLTGANFRRNLWTLWMLDQMLTPHLEQIGILEEVLEPGCQDFSRLPALRSFFSSIARTPRITGLEVDPFPVLNDLRSRWDRAQYYLSLEKNRDRYVAGDFFKWQERSDLVLCFYPFVSTYPALAWGLPASFGNARPWIFGFQRTLRTGGHLLLIHQGDWEQEDFDKARVGSHLKLVERKVLECPFYPQPHPACASLYVKVE